jgi:CRISPR/Cas system CSM-associated protein Csm3 (group 7 of RAMP superfamily)
MNILYLNMSGNYRNIIQTGIIFILAKGTGSIIERLIDINSSLRRIEIKLENNLNRKEE